MNSKKVWILPGDSRGDAIQMFKDRGWEPGAWPETADLICFLGGTDVDPEVYGAERHPMTQSPDKVRDKFEVEVFKKFKDIPKVGICRGGQLLNVLNGGTMIQHLHGTISGIVLMSTNSWDQDRQVLVDHHQGMIANEEKSDNDSIHWNEEHEAWPDYVVYYPETKSLCFQPHPEWGHKPTEDYFFELLEEHLGFKDGL